MATVINFKRGDSFILGAQATSGIDSLTGWTIRSQVRNGDTLVAELDVDVTDEAACEYTLSFAGSTSAWPLRRLETDIEYTNPGGQVISTETYYINVLKDVTRS